MPASRPILRIELTGGIGAGMESLPERLNALYPGATLEPFAVLDGAVRGVLRPSEDPLRAVVLVSLDAEVAGACWRIEWAAPDDPVGAGRVPADAGRVPGDADRVAGSATGEGDRIAISTGDPGADSLLADLLPAVADLLEDLTERQREIVRLAIIDGLRQSEVAQRLGVARATVSISFDRAHVASLRRLLRAISRIAAAGWSRAAAECAAESAPPGARRTATRER